MAIMEDAKHTVIIIGAGFGGLAAGIRLAAAGCAVTIIDSHATVGGKARAIASIAGPVDTGPTVLTMRHVFDDLFALNHESLDDHIRLIPQPILARHWWPDGSTLDLTPDRDANIKAIAAFAGAREARAFARFDTLAERLRSTFDQPVMQGPKPDLKAIAKAAISSPAIWPALIPGMTLSRLLSFYFRDPRLRQLFGRYATYVGGRPIHSPAVLALIWRTEAQGVWAVQGGMHSLAQALADLFQRLGGRILLNTHATRINIQSGCVTGVQTRDAAIPAHSVVFNGDPAALTQGLLGQSASVIPARATQPRSLSAHVWAFAATPSGPPLIHHNVFFTDTPTGEFGPIGRGHMPETPSLYVCAQDRAVIGLKRGAPTGPERFEIIINAPAGLKPTPSEEATCRTRTFQTLARFGLTFTDGAKTLTTPSTLDQMFPASMGAIYGRSPEGTLAAFSRPQAITKLPGLYLAGGGAHPGAGVPMAALSGRHAAAAILTGRISASKLALTVTPGGTSTESATTAQKPSASSAS